MAVLSCLVLRTMALILLLDAVPQSTATFEKDVRRQPSAALPLNLRSGHNFKITLFKGNNVQVLRSRRDPP